MKKSMMIQWGMSENMNTISKNTSGIIKASISRDTAALLNRYTPKGCPFNDYTLLDLLRDFIQAYSWKITRGTTMSIRVFIKHLQCEGYDKAMTYGDDIINLIEE